MKKILKYAILIIVAIGLFIIKDKDIYLFKNESVDINKLNDTTNIVLVNKNNKLESQYIPGNLVKPNIPFVEGAIEEEKQVSEVVSKSIEKLFTQAREEGIYLLGSSGYRSYETQRDIYENRVKSQGIKKANQYVAKPGNSEHQTGLCIDVTNTDRWFIEITKEARWLKENAYRFGFIIRYPKDKENITKIQYEPWHIRYVGEDIAKYIYEYDLTLEEYIDRK